MTFAEENGLPEGLVGRQDAGMNAKAYAPPPEEVMQVRSMVLQTMQDEVMDNNRAHGWHDEPRTFGDDIALLHSEVSEMLEAFRDYDTRSLTEHPNGEMCDSKSCHAPGKPQGVGSEAGDVLVRLLDTCGRHGIDLHYEYERKMAYNRTRPYRHGGRAL